MRKKNLVYMMIAVMAASTLFGCSKESSGEEATAEETITGKDQNKNADKSTDKNSTTDTDSEQTVVEGSLEDIVAEYDDEDYTRIAIKGEGFESTEGVTVLESTTENTIYLEENAIESSVTGVTVDGTTVTITSPGIYVLTGTLKDGQLVVDCADKGTVMVVLHNAEINNSVNSPVYIKDSSKTLLVLAEGSKNVLTDATEYTYADAENEEPSACLFSKEDLVISGNGALTVSANFNNGIASKDTLKITGGDITVDAKNNAIKGKDCLQIAGGTFKLTAEGDGLQSDNEDLTSTGFINISGGEFTIVAGADGVQAFSQLAVSGGTFAITTGDGSESVNMNQKENFGFGGNASQTENTVSMKGLKAGLDIQVSGGEITIDAEDDAVHSNGTCVIKAGTLALASGDDGIHAEDTLSVDGGNINITKSYEGVESPEIVFNGGTTYIVASDDGTNAAGGELNNQNNQGFGKMGGMMSTSSGTMVINDGYIYMNAGGDGLDANGNLTMNGGTVIVEGPVNDGNTAVDYDGSFVINGGFLIASGSSGMVEGVANSSEQNALSVYLGENISGGDTFAVLDENGAMVVAYKVSKTSAHVIFSSEKLVKGKTYTIVTGGTCDGTEKDGLYTDGNYAGGTEVGTVTISSSVSTVGSGGSQFGGGQFGGGHMGDDQFGGGHMGGGRKDENMQLPDEPETPEGMELPSDFEMPEGVEPPEGMEKPSGMGRPDGGQLPENFS